MNTSASALSSTCSRRREVSWGVPAAQPFPGPLSDPAPTPPPTALPVSTPRRLALGSVLSPSTRGTP